jgi:hypothetical protein
MRWLDTDHIISWAMRQDSIGILPELFQGLIRATSPKSTFANFPSGKQIFNSGTDGFVSSLERSQYVPEGVSVWELGIRQDIKAKADEDYEKRTQKPKGYEPIESTFIFATPHSWPGKTDWVNEKKLEKKWKDVRAYDCSDLAGWFDTAEVIAREYAPIISYYPRDGIQTTKDFWFEWSGRENGMQLPPGIITSGREFQMSEIRNFLAGNANIKAIKASSKDEAIAFVIACVMQFNEEEQANFFSRSLIVDSESNFRSISSKKQSLILISRVEKNQIIHRGPMESNHVFLPLGGDDAYSGDTITLPQISRDGIIKALKDVGFTDEEAQKFTRESGHSITILKRLLHFPIVNSEWARPENIRTVIPAVLVGRWDEDKKGDKETLSAIAGEEYEKVIENLIKWKSNEVPFIYQIGNTWRLTSPLDAWANTSSFITKNDLKKLEEISLEVLRNIRPAFDLEPEKRQLASFYGKESNYSSWLREGLVQSLILIAIHGQGMELPINTTPQVWVDSIIIKLLSQAEGKLWASLNYVMPLIAEASPHSFLSSVEKSLHKENPEIIGMFEEEPSMITPQSHHTGLLWALEALAWMPDHLPRVTLILGKLARLDPGGTLSNRPINSLRSIFLPWMPQTFADLEKRDKALQLLVKYEPTIAWNVFISLLPRHHDVAHPTHKTRWRLFGEKSEEKRVTYEEVWKNHSLIVKNLLSITEFSESKISQLVEAIDDLSPSDRNKIVDFIRENKKNIEQVDYSIWHQLRKILGRHRSYPESNWALPESELNAIDSLYKELAPTDLVQTYKWMFNENWPEFPGGFNHNDINHESQEAFIKEKRIEGLKAIYDKYDLKIIEELANEVKEKWIFGDTAAHIIDEENDILKFLSEKRLLDKDLYLIWGFILKKEQLNGFEWAINLFNKLKEKGYSNIALANFLIPLKQGQQLWNFLENENSEILQHYWSTLRPFTYNLSIEEKQYALEKLLSVNRGLTALAESYRDINGLPIELVIKILEAGVVAKENIRFPSHEIEHIFDALDKRNDVDRTTLARLEWKYLSVLVGNYTSRKPKILHEELSASPEFFIEILKLIYKPKSYDETTDRLSDEEKKAIVRIAEQAYNLLTSWKKVPGTDNENNIDTTKLRSWVNQVRDLALKEERLTPADIHIGKLFAHFPQTKKEQWPPDIICELIDTINSDAITRNFGTEIFNMRGFSSKAPYEGGDRERNLAQYFMSLAEKINYKWPITANVFFDLAKGYEADAIREDERAKRDSLEY